MAANGIHVYEDAPLAVRVAVFPLHKTEGVESTVIVGDGITLRLITAVAEHKPVEPVTV